MSDANLEELRALAQIGFRIEAVHSTLSCDGLIHRKSPHKRTNWRLVGHEIRHIPRDARTYLRPALRAIANIRHLLIDTAQIADDAQNVRLASAALRDRVCTSLVMVRKSLSDVESLASFSLLQRDADMEFRKINPIRLIRNALREANQLCGGHLLESSAMVEVVCSENERKMKGCAPSDIPDDILQSVRSVIKILGPETPSKTVRLEVRKNNTLVLKALSYLKTKGEWIGRRKK